jgi:ABC-type phosphate/phosphonate transport system substrate-binding protein
MRLVVEVYLSKSIAFEVEAKALQAHESVLQAWTADAFAIILSGWFILCTNDPLIVLNRVSGKVPVEENRALTMEPTQGAREGYCKGMVLWVNID